MFEGLSLPERNRIESLDDRGYSMGRGIPVKMAWARSGTSRRSPMPLHQPALFMTVRGEIAWKPGEGHEASGKTFLLVTP